jgi:chromate transporter
MENHWLTETQFIDAVAVAMITPGPVVITVGFIGYLIGGFPGATVASLATFLPVIYSPLFLLPILKNSPKTNRSKHLWMALPPPFWEHSWVRLLSLR